MKHKSSGNQIRRRRFSPLTLRILSINIFPLFVLVGGLLYLGTYREKLEISLLKEMHFQAELFASAISASATQVNEENQRQYLAPKTASLIIAGIIDNKSLTVHLFGRDGTLIADSQQIRNARRRVEVRLLPPPVASYTMAERIGGSVTSFFRTMKTYFLGGASPQDEGSLLPNVAHNYPYAARALGGETVYDTRHLPSGKSLLMVAVPVLGYKTPLGALLLFNSSNAIDQALLDIRLSIIGIACMVFGLTILLSLYLSRSIALPASKLAQAADTMRLSMHLKNELPDYNMRDDEIGDLSKSLHHMTDALIERLEAIDRFASDVSHEIKNPLASIKSAYETYQRLQDNDKKQRLLDIIDADIERLDRLINVIAATSRLDSELHLSRTDSVDMGALLETVIQSHTHPHVDKGSDAGDAGDKDIRLDKPDGVIICVDGLKIRLEQVFHNLIDNALSFSGTQKTVRISLSFRDDKVSVIVDDCGRGISAGMEEDIFRRFYSERSFNEQSQHHAGLGLNISLQIVHAHHGVIRAENRLDEDGNILGARFSVILPGWKESVDV